MTLFFLKFNWMYVRAICAFAFLAIGSCQQSAQNSAESPQSLKDTNIKQLADLDRLEDLADKMREESDVVEESSIRVALHGWTADKNLNTVRRVALTNIGNKKIVGVKLVYVLPMGKSTENRDLGKFRLQLNPSNNFVLKIPARRFRVADNIIEADAMSRAMFPDDNVAVSVICFENGDVETHDFPIGFQRNEQP